MTRAKMPPWPWALACLSLALTWLLLAWRSEAEPETTVRLLSGVPLELAGGWAGQERVVPQHERELLGASEVLLRDYRRAAANQVEPVAPISLFIAFYQSQRTGATYHSPQNCLPGAGWQITELDTINLPVSANQVVRVNQVVIQKGLERQLVYYWYQDRGRILASEYWAKYYMVYDALTQNRSDGAMVRVSSPVLGELPEAKHNLEAFIVDVWQPLVTALPGKRSIMEHAAPSLANRAKVPGHG